MTRQRAAGYTPAHDPYAAHRCVNCYPHMVYKDDVIGGVCRWETCGCTDHRPSTQHFLVVHEEPDDGMDIAHPPTCPTREIYDGRVLIHTCDVERIADEWGLDMFFRRDGDVAPAGRLDSEQVKPGRHPIEVWGDGNLRLSEVSDA